MEINLNASVLFFFALSCNGFLMKPKASLLNLNNCPLECYCQDSYSIFLILLFPQVTFAGYGVFPGLSADIKHTMCRSENIIIPIGNHQIH